MLWLKTVHIVFMVTWFAGLFYLPRLFVYHAMEQQGATRATFKTMQRRLLVMTHIGGSLTILSGVSLIGSRPDLLAAGWLQLKLALVLALLLYHAACAHFVRVFAEDRNTRSHRWYRVFNELPTLLLIACVALAVLKPF